MKPAWMLVGFVTLVVVLGGSRLRAQQSIVPTLGNDQETVVPESLTLILRRLPPVGGDASSFPGMERLPDTGDEVAGGLVRLPRAPVERNQPIEDWRGYQDPVTSFRFQAMGGGENGLRRLPAVLR